MKKLLSVMLTLILTGTLLAGCKQQAENNAGISGTPSGGKGGGDEIVVNVYDWDSGYDTSIVERFNAENPGIRVVFNAIPDNGDQVTKLDVLAMGGGDVDIMPLADGNQFLRMQNGMLASLDEFIEADGIDMQADYGAHASWAQLDGKIYGLPLRVNIQGIFYNKDMFDEAGLAYPDDNWTLDDYVETAKKLTHGSGPSKVYGTYTHVWSGEWNVIGSEKSGYYTTDGQCNFGSPAIRTMLELRTTLDKEGIQQSFDQIAAVKAMPNSSFLGEQCAMAQCGSWLIRDMKDQERFPHEFNIGWNYLPRFDDTIGKKAINTSVSILAIPETSKNKEAAWKYLRYYIEENSKSIAASGNIPCYLPAYDDELINVYIDGSGLDMEYARKLFATDVTASSSKFGAPPDTYPSAPQYDQIANEELELYFNGEQNLDTTISNVVTRVSKIIDEN